MYNFKCNKVRNICHSQQMCYYNLKITLWLFKFTLHLIQNWTYDSQSKTLLFTNKWKHNQWTSYLTIYWFMAAMSYKTSRHLIKISIFKTNEIRFKIKNKKRNFFIRKSFDRCDRWHLCVNKQNKRITL